MALGKNPADISTDLVVARRAVEAGVWFHSSPTYNQGFTYMVLRIAFDEDRRRTPKLILKVRDASVELMRFEVEDSCRRLGIETIDVAQLVSMDSSPSNLIDQLCNGGGPLVNELASLRQRGLIQKAVIFLNPQNSDAALSACRSELIDGVTLYWNACQRDCSDSSWAEIRRKQIPTLALRTLGGGPKDENQRRKASRISELIKQADCQNATDFNLRLAASEKAIQTTIGGTSSLTHLEEFLTAGDNPTPLGHGILASVESVQTS
jgi:aryl-alcohol dehydrogenase-like predicted oxidoreductase